MFEFANRRLVRTMPAKKQAARPSTPEGDAAVSIAGSATDRGAEPGRKPTRRPGG